MFKFNALGDVVLNQTFSSVEDYHSGSASTVTATDDRGYAVLGSLSGAVWLAKFTPDTAKASDAPEMNSSLLIIGFKATVVTVLAVAVLAKIGYFKKHKQTQAKKLLN